MKLFGFDISRTKADTRPVVQVNEEMLYRMLFETMSPFIKLKRDSNALDLITDGYEVSPDVFGIVSKVSTMFSEIPVKIFQGEKELETGPLEEWFKDNPSDYTLAEFRRNWEAMGMVTGESIVFHVLRSGTGDKILQFQLAPSQHVEIVYGDWLNPIKGYTLDLAADTKDKIIPPENIWHVRQFANLDFMEGKNYRGLSPIRVAAKVINSQVFGQELVEASYKRGMPPGILTKKGEAWDATSVEEQRKDMEGVWDRKYSNRKRAGKPIFTVGDLAWIPIGFSSFTDLQIEGINKIALRTLCNVWGIPSRVMNDMDGGAYTKDLEDRKAIYTNRLIPDNRMFWDGVNYLIQSTGIRYEPDYSKVPELQENKKDGVEMFRVGYECNAVQVNEMRERLQLEPDPEMEGLYKQDIGSDPELDEDVL